MKLRAITLLSGGLDSSVATLLASQECDIALAVTFDYGQRAARREIETAGGTARGLRIAHQVIPLPWLAGATATALVDRSLPLPEAMPWSVDEASAKNAEAVWVPNRNGLFVAIAAAMAESRGIPLVIAGFNAEEAATFPDNSRAFVEKSNAALALSTKSGVRVESPVLQMAKDEIAQRFVALGADPTSFWCCYEGGERLCGRCESCARTMRAFQKIGAWELIRGRFA